MGRITSYTATSDCILCLQNYQSGAGSSYNSIGTHTYAIQINGSTVNSGTWSGGTSWNGGGYLNIPAFSYFLSMGDTVAITARFTGKYYDSEGEHTVSNKDSLMSCGTATLIEF